jgi:hypothetical protein
LEFFELAGRNLLPAEAAAGVAHHVALSVVGANSPASPFAPRWPRRDSSGLPGSPIPFSAPHNSSSS